MSRLALAVRWLGPLSVLLTALFFDAVGASVMMLVCLAITITWRARLPAALEITTDLTLLVAAWSSVFLLYERYDHWDLVVHFAATAVLALPLAEASLKVRTGGPGDDEPDIAVRHHSASSRATRAVNAPSKAPCVWREVVKPSGFGVSRLQPL